MSTSGARGDRAKRLMLLLKRGASFASEMGRASRFRTAVQNVANACPEASLDSSMWGVYARAQIWLHSIRRVRVNVKSYAGGDPNRARRDQRAAARREVRMRRTEWRAGTAIVCGSEKGSSASGSKSGGGCACCASLRSSRTHRANRAWAVSSIHWSSNAAISRRKLAA